MVRRSLHTYPHGTDKRQKTNVKGKRYLPCLRYLIYLLSSVDMGTGTSLLFSFFRTLSLSLLLPLSLYVCARTHEGMIE